MERLKTATELKLVSRGNEFHAFTTRSLKKPRPCTGGATPFKQFKTVTTRVFNKTKLKKAINRHLIYTKQNFVAPTEISNLSNYFLLLVLSYHESRRKGCHT